MPGHQPWSQRAALSKILTSFLGGVDVALNDLVLGRRFAMRLDGDARLVDVDSLLTELFVPLAAGDVVKRELFKAWRTIGGARALTPCSFAWPGSTI